MSSKVYFAPARAKRWDYSASQVAGLERLIEKMVLYFNFVLEVQPECDCMPMADTPLVQHQGILASRDIVAVEQAALYLINNRVPLPGSLAEYRGLKAGQRILAEALGVDGQLHVDAAAQIGLGSREYELIEV